MRNEEGETALFIAAYNGDLKTAAELIKHGIDLNAQDHEGNTALHGAALRKNNHIIVQFLIQNGARADIKNLEKNTPFREADMHNDPAGMRALLQGVTDVHASLDWKDSTPLHFAAKIGDVAAMKQLIEKGASMLKSNRCRETPLSMAYHHLVYSKEPDPELAPFLKTFET